MMFYKHKCHSFWCYLDFRISMLDSISGEFLTNSDSFNLNLKSLDSYYYTVLQF